jgi:hypothetical protein
MEVDGYGKMREGFMKNAQCGTWSRRERKGWVPSVSRPASPKAHSHLIGFQTMPSQFGTLLTSDSFAYTSIRLSIT